MPDDVRKPVIDKSHLPSRHVTVGPERAPHRAFLYSMGLTDEQINQPLVGVATTWNEAAPCNIALARQAQAAKKGVAAAHGTPREFTTITVTDGIAMGHAGMKASLISREIIANSVELTMRGHCYDALVGLAGCDKSLPGMMMAMVRLNVPIGVHVWRLDHAGPVPRQGRDDRRRLRVGRQAQRQGRRATRICTSSNASPARRRARAAGCSRRTRWPACPRRSGSRCPARPARRRPTIRATPMPRPRGRPVMELFGDEPAPARHRHPEIAGKRRDRRRRGRRFDQFRAASAGDRPRMRDRFRPARGRPDLRPHALYRQPEAGRRVRDEGPVRHRRRARC